MKRGGSGGGGGGGGRKVREKTLLFHFLWMVLGFLPADKSRAKHVAKKHL